MSPSTAGTAVRISTGLRASSTGTSPGRVRTSRGLMRRRGSAWFTRPRQLLARIGDQRGHDVIGNGDARRPGDDVVIPAPVSGPQDVAVLRANLNSAPVRTTAGQQLRVTVWAQQPEVPRAVVEAVPVLVIHRQRQGLAVPLESSRVERTRLLVAARWESSFLPPLRVVTPDRLLVSSARSITQHICRPSSYSRHTEMIPAMPACGPVRAWHGRSLGRLKAPPDHVLDPPRSLCHVGVLPEAQNPPSGPT